jgi:SAM-dependent methyltransferase
MRAAERWLTAVWPVVRGRLPASPARVVEVGCGPFGGFVPLLRSSGYEAVGVDPEAPEGEDYRRVEFERVEEFAGVDAVVASASLHHVADPAEVIDRIASAIRPGGTLVVVEWDWESFDEATADWCFRRLGPGEETGWLQRRREGWLAAGEPWGVYLRGWAAQERLHAAGTLLRLLDGRIDRVHLARGPYFFPQLEKTSPEDEAAAIQRGEIRATRIDYVGRVRPRRGQ